MQNMDLKYLAQELHDYSQKSKDIVPHNLMWLLTNYNFGKFQSEVKQIFNLYSFESQSTPLMALNFSKFGYLIGKTKQIKKLEKVAEILKIKVDGECGGLFQLA